MAEGKQETETIQETLNLLQELMLDPTRVTIWFEILRRPSITAKELMKVIKIKKTAMYYHLDKLERNVVISAETIKGQKHYKIIKNFFEFYERSGEELRGMKKEFNLFSLLIVNSLVQREINRLINSSEEEVKKRKYPISYVGMWFCSREKLKLVKEDYKKLFHKMKTIDEDEDKDSIVDAKITYYWGLVDFE
jgi:predicted transcriptional regulator